MSAGVQLRLYQESDAQSLTEAVRESYAEVSRWMVWCRADYGTDDAMAWIRATRAGHESGSMYEFAVVDSDGRYCGGCGINHINPVDRFANLGYWVRTSRAGQGVATEAARALITWTIANTQLNRIEIVAAVENRASQRVAEKLQANREAVLRKRLVVGGASVDAVMYSVVRANC